MCDVSIFMDLYADYMLYADICNATRPSSISFAFSHN